MDNAAGVLAFASSGLTYNVASLSGSGNIALLGVSGGSLTLNIGSNNASTTYAGNLSGSGALVKVGGGMFSLTGANAMTGGVTVSGGTLQLAGLSGGTGTLPNSTYITVNNNAALLVNGADVLGYNPGTNIVLNDGLVSRDRRKPRSFNVITLTGGTIGSAAGLGDGTGNWLLNGQISATSDAAGNPADQRPAVRPELGGRHLLQRRRGIAAAGPDLVVSSIVANWAYSGSNGNNLGTSTLTKTGNGLMELTGSNIYSGGTVINGGTLQMGPGDNAALGSTSGSLAVVGGLLDLNGNSPTVGR